MKSRLEKNTIELCSTHNEVKSVVAERFIKTLKNKLYTISKNVYIDKLGDIANKHNNTYHRSIKIKPAYVKLRIYIDFNKENNKFKVLNLKLVIMLECQNIKIFCKRLCSKLI